MPRKTISISIAEDMQLDLTLIEHQIKAIKNISILFKSGNGKDLLFKLKQFKPDVIILDLYMPFMDGWEVLHELKAINYSGNIICTSNTFEPNLQSKLTALGVKGFVSKQSNYLAKAIKEVIIGNTFFETIFVEPKQILSKNFNLNGKEIRIINKIAQGKESKTIAQEIGGLSYNSVDTYIKNILQKTGCINRAHLTNFAHNHGLIYTFTDF